MGDTNPKLRIAAVVGMSALLTATMPAMRATIEALEEAGLHGPVRVIVVGAAITAEYARSIGADAYAPDASVAVRTVRGLVSPGPAGQTAREGV